MSLPETPLTRRETYLAKAAGQAVTLPETDLTREELYLRAIAEGGGGGGTSPFYPAGNTAFANLPELSADILGAMYNITDAFTTDSRFNEGAGVDYPAGTNVAVVNVGTAESPVLKYDTFAGAYVVDNALSDASENPVQNKVIKSALDGKATPADIAALINDTTAAQDKTYSSAKVEEKVAGEEITTTATGSDLTLSTAEGNLNALTVYGKSEVVDGSIKSAGEDGSIEVETCGKNLIDITKSADVVRPDGVTRNGLSFFGLNGIYTLSQEAGLSVFYYGVWNGNQWSETGTIQPNTSEIIILNATKSLWLWVAENYQMSQIITTAQLEVGSTATAYEPYNGTMATFSTGTPLRGIPDSNVRDVMVWNGSAGTVTKNCAKVRLADLPWSEPVVTEYRSVFAAIFVNFKQELNDTIAPNLLTVNFQAVPNNSAWVPGDISNRAWNNSIVLITEPTITTVTDLKASLGDAELVYELATPVVEQLTQTENASIAGLRTFEPQTHAQNNAGATMTVEAYAGTANGKAVQELKQDVQSEISALKITQSGTLTLTVAGWTNNTQTVTYAHDTAKRNVIDVDPSSVEEWASCGVLATAETASGITFSCKTVPENALNFRVTSMGV